MSSVGEKEKADYKKRKLVVEVTDKLFTLTKGPDFALTIAHTEAELTPEMLQSGSWKETDFKPYNFAALGVTPPGGHLHPLLKVLLRIHLLIYILDFWNMAYFTLKQTPLPRSEPNTARSSLRWASQRCRPTTLWSRASGISMPYSSLSNTQPGEGSVTISQVLIY